MRELLGRPKVHPEHAAEHDEVGIATGMYYTPMGGDIMFVEASSIRRGVVASGGRDGGDEHGARCGPISLILTGQLGDVMKESARAALTYATNNAAAAGHSRRPRCDGQRSAHPRAGRCDSQGRTERRHRDRHGAGERDVESQGAS